MNKNKVTLFVAAALAISSPATANIISGTVTGGSAFTDGGTFVKLTMPLGNPFGAANSVGLDTFQSPNLYAFNEDQNILLTADLAVDIGNSPLLAGMTVASHYVFFDPGPAQDVSGTVNFDSDVLAIITSTGLLNASDFLANTGVNYLNPISRGLEPVDSVTISGTRQILFNALASSPGDYVRVLTTFSPGGVVPEPGTLPVLGIGLAGIAVALYRRKLRRPTAARG